MRWIAKLESPGRRPALYCLEAPDLPGALRQVADRLEIAWASGRLEVPTGKVPTGSRLEAELDRMPTGSRFICYPLAMAAGGET